MKLVAISSSIGIVLNSVCYTGQYPARPMKQSCLSSSYLNLASAFDGETFLRAHLGTRPELAGPRTCASLAHERAPDQAMHLADGNQTTISPPRPAHTAASGTIASIALGRSQDWDIRNLTSLPCRPYGLCVQQVRVKGRP